MTVTVVGSSGFLGKQIVLLFQNQNEDVISINKGDQIDPNLHYGTIFYCAGVSINFNQRAFETVEAHVVQLMKWLQVARLDKLVYVSSTRLYSDMLKSSEDTNKIRINTHDIYNQTKILGENLCALSDHATVVLRISNVISGSPDSPYFLWSILRELKRKKSVHIVETEDSARDYLLLSDFLNIVDLVKKKNVKGLYNIASGVNISHKKLFSTLLPFSNDMKITFGNKKNHSKRINNKKASETFDYDFIDPSEYIKKISQKYLKIKVENNEI